MDSFYDAPRKTPVPVATERVLPTTLVPEVSMLCTDKQYIQNRWHGPPQFENYSNKNKENTYRNWEQPKTCSPRNISSFSKKHVRFESPTVKHGTPPSCNVLQMEYHKELDKNLNLQDVKSNSSKPVILNGRNFEEIYMANVPNRDLDLSIIQPQKETHKYQILNEKMKEPSSKSPNTYREFLEYQERQLDQMDSCNNILEDISSQTLNSKRNDVADYISKLPNMTCNKNNILASYLHNTKIEDRYIQKDMQTTIKDKQRNENFNSNQTISSKHKTIQNNISSKCDSVTQTSETYTEITTPNNEPSVKDLLKIISQQNEQLILLQKQVASLINKENQKQIEPSTVLPTEKYLTSTQHEQFKGSNVTDMLNSPKKRALPKFSIDLMTSFEVSFRPQTKHKEYINYEPKIQEITETDSTTRTNDNKRSVDNSIHLNEPLIVRETCPSPEPSIKIDMNDYDSTDDEEDISDIGATFYQNLMGQVNNILRKAQLQTNDTLGERSAGISEKLKEKTMSKVKEATLKHLKSIGVTLPSEIDDSVDSEMSDADKHANLEDISFVVKQLLMKYLPNEHLAKLTLKQTENRVLEGEGTPGLIPTRPEFSFATVQYMKKYNLITKNDDNKNPGNIRPIQKCIDGLQKRDVKILDISALKQQPKLL